MPGPTPWGKIERGHALRHAEISLSQGVEWKALISKYIGTIPPTGDAFAAEQRLSSGPPPYNRSKQRHDREGRRGRERIAI